MSSTFFRHYGSVCATYPWEVIFATVTLTTCLFTIDRQQSDGSVKEYGYEADFNAMNVIIMTAVRCVAILYSYYQLRNLRKLDCKYILIISGFFVVFSSFVFSSTVVNFLQIQVSDLKDALFFFLLLVDLSKISLLAQFALSGRTSEDVKRNIAKGMSVLGPIITLDTIVETLLLSVGTLSGVRHLEVLSCFAVLSVLVNYVVFMTFYPACLYLILELSQLDGSSFNIHVREDQKMNPVVQRVKMIMSAGLTVVHVHSRLTSRDANDVVGRLEQKSNSTTQQVGGGGLNEYLLKWATLSCDHLVILTLIIALVVKFVLFEYAEEREVCENLRLENRAVQTEIAARQAVSDVSSTADDDLSPEQRPIDEILKVYSSSPKLLSDGEIVTLVNLNHVASHQLERIVGDPMRGVQIRRRWQARQLPSIVDLPYDNYDYSKVLGSCCENVVGYVPVPVGIVGPLLLDGRTYHVPMATTEGCLIASTSRGCKALANGVTSRVVADGMTRGPVVRFPSLERASAALSWIEQSDNFRGIKDNFDSTSGYARLTKIQAKIAGRYLFLRFVATTGDAMGMNMVSKGAERSLQHIARFFPDMDLLSLSGNFCTDKKAAAVNWIEGRGKSVVCDAVVPGDAVRRVLKTEVHALVDANISKNLVGSAVSGSIGGFNAHSSNIVTAVFIATGQDPAQNVSSSNCLTLMEPCADSDGLYVSCTMPSLEVGTVGGGTILPGQAACLDMLGVRGSNDDNPGENASRLAKIICATVLAGELSLMAALTSGDLVRSHLKYNRKPPPPPPQQQQRSNSK